LLGAGWLKKLSSSAERPFVLSASFLSGDGEVVTVEEPVDGALRKLLKISSPPEVPAPPADEDVPTGVSAKKKKYMNKCISATPSLWNNLHSCIFYLGTGKKKKPYPYLKLRLQKLQLIPLALHQNFVHYAANIHTVNT
jgi:hypothetical protein